MRTTTNFEDPWHQYVVSSPSNGLQSELEGYIAQYPSDNKYGDGKYFKFFFSFACFFELIQIRVKINYFVYCQQFTSTIM